MDSASELVSVQRIWDEAPHNAFTDLIRHNDEWICVFREGKSHVSDDGALRVITSPDGETWTSAALLTMEGVDLRDAKIAVTPEGELMLGGAVRRHDTEPHGFQSLVWFSKDGRTWSEAIEVGDPEVWLWRTTWHKGMAYNFGYSTLSSERFMTLYTSKDGRQFDKLVPRISIDDTYLNETQMAFLPDDTALCLLRRDPDTGMLGSARPPYTEWEWEDLGVRMGGPAMLRLPDGRLVACVRRPDIDPVYTGLGWIDADAATYTEFLKLPSGGDTSYAGLVWHDDLLWVSYYSSHEATTSIYLAKVRVP